MSAKLQANGNSDIFIDDMKDGQVGTIVKWISDSDNNNYCGMLIQRVLYDIVEIGGINRLADFFDDQRIEKRSHEKHKYMVRLLTKEDSIVIDNNDL